ncbi:MAG TPA: type VI secretion system tip protein TssI/VgrG [Polyangiaceae bacterium]|jgi:type VI secretion system secreted protein VgrG|nr:type VI secretion system tip protein TssI/VgrG [Polyangiaceae bacterium]
MAFTLSFPDAKNPGFDLLSFELRDDMSRLFSLDLMVQSTDAGIEMASLVGQRVALNFGPGMILPQVTGIIREVRVISTETTGVSRYHLFVVPPLWLTTRRTNHRIFQRRTAVQIVNDVLADYGSRIGHPLERLGGTYQERAYCAQYGETDHDFIFRILADEGIATFFDHSNGSRWVLVDQTDTLTPEHRPPIPYIEPSLGNAPPVPSVNATIVTAKIKTSATAVRDYDHLNPSFTIQARSTAKGAELFIEEGELEAYTFRVGDVSDEEQANERAKRLLEATRAPGRRLEMTTNFAIAPGTRMHLTGHPRDDVNGALLVTRLMAVGQELNASQHLECVDAATPFRPKRTPRPRIIGTQTAFVVPTTAGDEIDADKLGQVKIEFRWDRRGLGVDTSRFVRVSQAWAGSDYGLICLPRVGDEVVVDFLDGDPDQPIIIGRVHNAVNVRPFNSPAERTISVWRSKSSPGGKGFNQILLDDKAGAERLELHAQRDFKSETGRNSVTLVTNNQSIKAGGNSSTKIAGAQTISAGSTSISTGAYKLSAKSIEEKSQTDITLTAANIRRDGSINHFIDTQGFWIGANSVMQVVTPRFVVFSGDIVLDAGGSKISISSDGIKITSGGTIEINGAVVDVKGAPIKLNS